MSDVSLRAFEVLAAHPRLADLAAIAHAVVCGLAEARSVEVYDEVGVRELADARKLTTDEGTTPFGNALSVLVRVAKDDAERALASALWAHALAVHGEEPTSRLAADILWLALHTPFDATPLLDRALGERAESLWKALAEQVREITAGKGAPFGRGEALMAAVALARSTSEVALRERELLAQAVHDEAVAFVLQGPCATPQDLEPLVGEMASAPRGRFTTVTLAVTGLLLLLQAGRLFARLALGYKRPAEVIVSPGSVQIHFRTEMLGRTLRDGNVVIQRAGLAQAEREVRYPRAAFYAGLTALAAGSYVGVGTFVDGIRAASPSLLATGLLVVLAGLGLDFVCRSLVPGARGRCRVLLVTRQGAKLCVSGVDPAQADAALAALRG
jgi:hypothetical protein